MPLTLAGLVQAFRQLLRGNVAGHRKTMLGLYLGACVGAGAFTLLPQRYLGQLVWGHWLVLLCRRRLNPRNLYLTPVFLTPFWRSP